MRSVKSGLAVLLPLILAAGCCMTPTSSSVSPSASGPHERRALVAPQVEISLPLPGPEDWSKKELLTFDYKGQQTQIFASSHCSQGMLHVFTSEPISATPLTEIFDDGQVLSVQRRSVAPTEVSAAQLLNDILLAQASVQQWQAVLPAGWSVLEIGNQRDFLDARGEPVSTVIYADNCPQRSPVYVEHHRFGYSIRIYDFDCPQANEPQV